MIVGLLDNLAAIQISLEAKICFLRGHSMSNDYFPIKKDQIFED